MRTRNVDICGGGFVLLAYAVMALADGLGALSSRTGLVGVSSSLFFIWFAVAPIPIGVLCSRIGAVRVLRLALVASVLACALLGACALGKWYSAAGFCLAGLANVFLQVAVPTFAADRFSASRTAGVLTGGLFAKTAVSVAFPFALHALACRGCWWLSLAPFAALATAACFIVENPLRDGGGKGETHPPVLAALRNVVKDPVVASATLAFAVAIIADVSFNLSVPGVVARRFGGDGAAVGVVYAVWFGVKLPLMLAGSRLFLVYGARRFFGVAVLVSLVGASFMLACGAWWAYLVGVGLFAAGFANVYGHVIDAAMPRHPAEASAVSSVLVMSIAAGALASPLLVAIGGLGSCAPEGLVLALVVLLLPFAMFLSAFRGKS